MNISSPLRTLPQLLALLVALASTLPLIHARVGEQENWYLAKEIILETEDYSQSIEIIEINGSETIAKFHASEIVLISLDGSKISYNTPLAHIYETVNLHNGGVIISASFNEVKVDDHTTELFYWNVNNGMQFTKINDSSGNSILTNSMNKNSLSLSQDNQRIIVCDPEDKLIVYKINQANAELPPELTKLNEISIPIVGGAPGEKYSIIPIFVEDDLLLFSDSENFHFFTTSGEFKKRTVPYPSHYGSIGQILETNNQGQILTTQFILDPEGDPIVRLSGNSLNSNVYSYGLGGSGFHDACFSNKGNLCILDNTNTLRYFKKAYRTKGTTTQNEIPKPVIRAVKQRPGTNIIDIDFEILDSDDALATAGILATLPVSDGYGGTGFYQDWSHKEFTFSNVIVLESLIEGTDIKIGKPISTNEIHRVSWYVKGDWDELSGDLKMGIFAQDQRRNKPVDLHFLTLPLSDNNITICRSPIESRDLENFLFYKLSLGELGIENRTVKVTGNNGLYWGEWQEIRPTLFKKDDNKILAHSDLTIHKEDIVHFEETAFEYFIQAFGEGYRWATEEEVRLCREANTPGSVNSFEISNKVIPRRLPNSVNEYGFDSSVSSSGRWIVKEN